MRSDETSTVGGAMARFLIVLGLAILLMGLLWPYLSKLGLGRLPGAGKRYALYPAGDVPDAQLGAEPHILGRQPVMGAQSGPVTPQRPTRSRLLPVLLDAGGAKPGKPVLVDRILPGEEFLDRKRVAAAGFLERQQAP